MRDNEVIAAADEHGIAMVFTGIRHFQPLTRNRRMKILVIGSGGREHALAWKLRSRRASTQVLVAPGNAGTAREPTRAQRRRRRERHRRRCSRSREREGVALTVVGPEAPLVAGVVDRFRARGLRIFGPTAAAAQLEG